MERKGIKSISELARQVKCSNTTIYNLTRKANKNPSIETMQMLASFFEITIDDLIADNALLLKQRAVKFCPLIVQTAIADFMKNPDNYPASVMEITTTGLSNRAFAIKLEYGIFPYLPGNVLIFDNKPVESIAFPNISLIRHADGYDLCMLYCIDDVFYIKQAMGFIGKKEALIPLDQKYDGEIEFIAALVEVKLYN